MIWYAAGLALALLAGCGGNTQSCTTTYGPPEAVMNAKNNYACPVGQVLVGYNPAAVGGPLLCASALVSCPLREK